VRLALLPWNPHFKSDVHIVREALHIPPSHIYVTEENIIWTQLQDIFKPEYSGRVMEGNLAGEWRYIHRKTALGRSIKEKDGQLFNVAILT
jgi:hypothetical protein